GRTEAAAGVGPGRRDGRGQGVEARHVHGVDVGAAGDAGVDGIALEPDGLAALARPHRRDDVRAVGDRPVGVERAGPAHALDEQPRAPAEERTHRPPPASSTILRAPSFMSVALTTLRPDSSMIRLPSSAFVPSSRTTSGTSRPTCLTAATTPFAIVSPFMMPPKMLTKIPLTLGSRV